MNPNPYENHRFKIINASNLATDKTYEFDVVIVGTGAGGGYAAELFAQQGLKVGIVEEGPFKHSKDFKMKEGAAYTSLYQEAANRMTTDKAIKILQGRSVGGGTTVNWTSSFRTPEFTLNYWKKVFGLELTAENMKPHFDEVAKRFNMKTWEGAPNENNDILARGLKKLGIEANVIPRNVKDCYNLGYCGMGCPVNAKQSTLITTIPSALSMGATLFHNLKAEKVNHKNGSVKELVCHALDRFCSGKTGRKVKIKAKKYVLSAGAVGTPAILLRSEIPDPNKLIGKRSFFHPVTASAGFYPDGVDGFYGAPQSIYSDHFLYNRGTEMGYKLEVAPIHPVLLSNAILKHGQDHFNFIKELPNLSAVISLCRDGFHEQSKGGEIHLRSDGSPEIRYEFTDYFKKTLRHSLMTNTEIQFAAGATKVYPVHKFAKKYETFKEAKAFINSASMEPRTMSVLSAHAMGGAGMGNNENTSVTDLKGKVRRTENLYVLDGSLFPTSLGVNPMMSIFGLVRKLILG